MHTMTLNLRRLIIFLSAVHLAAPLALADLRGEVQSAISNPKLRGAAIAISIRDADTNVELVDINDEQMLIPASNMKVFTTGAALHALGPDFEFKTRLMRDGDRLIIIGDGDPGFADPELLSLMSLGEQEGLDFESFVQLWVQPVIASGMKEVREIVVDARVFDREFVHPDWPADQLNRRYCAQVAGLNMHLNVLHFYPRPGTGGRRPDIAQVVPRSPWLTPINRGTSRGGAKEANSAWLSRQPDTNEFTFYGNVKVPYKVAVPVTIHDPPSYFAKLFAQRLDAAGLTVGGFRLASPGESVSDGTPLGPVVFTPLSTVVTRCNRDSQNLYAEALFKRTAYAMTRQPGSWAHGAAVMRQIIQDRVSDPALASRIIVRDGSGLSRNNRVAPALVTAWLDSLHRDEKLAGVFVESLAVGGESGTLDDRFTSRELHGAIVQAKSGYIDEVSCLSGYVTMPDGRRRSFSIMANNLRQGGSVAEAKKMQEAVVAAIARDMASLAPSLGGD
jgi:D-alanyl-D-alanine carboxypeptidase/D-alanyl-D-alanine-endopeptidase (penicillin-binding protein 4)